MPHEAGAEPLISVRGLQVSYGQRQVLAGVDLDIYRGETMVILGASGCGKSTLLRHIEGLETPSAGIDPDSRHPNRRGFAQGSGAGSPPARSPPSRAPRCSIR